METRGNLLIHLVSIQYEEFQAVIENELAPVQSGLRIQQHCGVNKCYLCLIIFCLFVFLVVHLGPGEERSEDAIMMNTPVVKAALEMGFERSLVKQTVQSKILTSGENYKTVQELVSDLLSAEDEKREEEREMFAEAMASGVSSPSCRFICQCKSSVVNDSV